MLFEALEDDTLRILLAAGALSLVLELGLEPEETLAGFYVNRGEGGTKQEDQSELSSVVLLCRVVHRIAGVIHAPLRLFLPTSCVRSS